MGDGNGSLRVKIVPTRDQKPTHDPRFTEPEPKPRYNVWIHKAEKLKGVNMFNSLSDSYVVVKTGVKTRFQTKVLYRNLNPVWDDGPHILELGGASEVVFEVRDKDMVGSKPIGTARLTRVACKRGFEGPLDLTPHGAG